MKLEEMLMERGAEVKAVRREMNSVECTPLMLAACMMANGRGDAHGLVHHLLVANGAQLAEGEIDKWQRHVDKIHVKCSVPRHKQLDYF